MDSQSSLRWRGCRHGNTAFWALRVDNKVEMHWEREGGGGCSTLGGWEINSKKKAASKVFLNHRGSLRVWQRKHAEESESEKGAFVSSHSFRRCVSTVAGWFRNVSRDVCDHSGKNAKRKLRLIKRTSSIWPLVLCHVEKKTTLHKTSGRDSGTVGKCVWQTHFWFWQSPVQPSDWTNGVREKDILTNL